MRQENQTSRRSRHTSRRSARHDEIMSVFCRTVDLHPEQLRAAYPNVTRLLHSLSSPPGRNGECL